MAHFARTRRPTSFDAVVGQDLAVRILKNSVYQNRIFPVYLFAGPRGCGKTTLARIFAAALACGRRDDFRRDPHGHPVPCGTCSSCVAFRAASHPDFHEIDAASHPGVDNVRQVIETTMLAPQLGALRIYLIDEAHMLSKAACNALLKTLEEPLETVVFMLATTEPHKIIDTVRSRCFFMHVAPLAREQLCAVLGAACRDEGIAYDDEGLERIADHADGSARDALTTLERMSLAYDRVTAVRVEELLGIPPREAVQRVWDGALADDSERVRALLQADLAHYRPRRLLDLLYEVGRQRLWGVGAEGSHEQHISAGQRQRLCRLLERLFHHEPMIVQSAHGMMLLQMILSEGDACDRDTARPVSPGTGAPGGQSARVASAAVMHDRSREVVRTVEPGVRVAPSATTNAAVHDISAPDDQDRAMRDVLTRACADDPLLTTLLHQMRWCEQDGAAMFTFPEKCALFDDMLQSKRSIFEQAASSTCGRAMRVQFVFAGAAQERSETKRVRPAQVPQRNGSVAPTTTQRTGPAPSASSRPPSSWQTQDRRDRPRPTSTAARQPAEIDPLTASVLHMFPGSVIEDR